MICEYKLNTDIVYRFVTKNQLIDIDKSRLLTPSPRKDIPERKGVFVTQDKDHIINIVQPMDYNCEEGYILTIDVKGIEFKPDPSYIGEKYMWSWYTTQAIHIDKIIDIEFIPRSYLCQ